MHGGVPASLTGAGGSLRSRADLTKLNRAFSTSIKIGSGISAPQLAGETTRLRDEQRAAQRAHLADASGWLAQMSEHFHGRLSDFNHAKVMRHAEELASGAGIQLPGLGERVFEGRPIHISDDLVALREEARAFARWDVGGWRLNHPIGKLIKFQQLLYSSSHPLYSSSPPDDAAAGGELPRLLGDRAMPLLNP